jgi:hypothetical protein
MPSLLDAAFGSGQLGLKHPLAGHPRDPAKPPELNYEEVRIYEQSNSIACKCEVASSRCPGHLRGTSKPHPVCGPEKAL